MRYGWIAGAIALVVIIYIFVNTLRTHGLGGGIPVGSHMPPFAVPLASSDLVGDANLATRNGAGAGKSGHTPACRVADPRALNLCRATDHHPVLLAFVTLGEGDAAAQLDSLARVQPRFPSVRFLAVTLRGDRGRARKLIAQHGWRFPVGFDRQGDVAAKYGVPVSPTLVFAYPGRVVMTSAYRRLSDAELTADLRRLVRGPARPGAPA
jgi:hypothetical protein